MKLSLAKTVLIATLSLHLAPSIADQTPKQQHVTTMSEHAIARTIRAQLNAFKARRFDLAYIHASESIQSRFPDKHSFRRMIENGYKVLLDPISIRFDGLDSRFQSAVYRIKLISHDGQHWLALYPMIVTKKGTWKINGCRLLQLTGKLI